jgi:hypothetical protein
MTEYRIHTFRKISAAALEKMVLATGLTCNLTTTLKSLAPNTHWHFKKGKERGVLEITLFDNSNEVLIQVQDGRKGEWIEGHIDMIKDMLT